MLRWKRRQAKQTVRMKRIMPLCDDDEFVSRQLIYPLNKSTFTLNTQRTSLRHIFGVGNKQKLPFHLLVLS